MDRQMDDETKLHITVLVFNSLVLKASHACPLDFFAPQNLYFSIHHRPTFSPLEDVFPPFQFFFVPLSCLFLVCWEVLEKHSLGRQDSQFNIAVNTLIEQILGNKIGWARA